jgi:hypothetical protein
MFSYQDIITADESNLEEKITKSGAEIWKNDTRAILHQILPL